MPYKDYNQSHNKRYESDEGKKYKAQNSSNYRVKSPVKSFRDLEVYQRTIQLYSEITNLEFLNKKSSEKDKEQIKEIAESIPKLIAESYGDKFDSKPLANQKLTQAVTLTTNIITKLDLLREQHKESQDNKEILDRLLTNYQRQKLKILNLRKAWQRIAEFEAVRKQAETIKTKSQLSPKR